MEELKNEGCSTGVAIALLKAIRSSISTGVYTKDYTLGALDTAIGIVENNYAHNKKLVKQLYDMSLKDV